MDRTEIVTYLKENQTISMEDACEQFGVTDDNDKLQVWKDLHDEWNKVLENTVNSEFMPITQTKNLMTSIIHQQMDVERLPALKETIKNPQNHQAFCQNLSACFDGFKRMGLNNMQPLHALRPLYAELVSEDIRSQHHNLLLPRIAAKGDWVEMSPDIHKTIEYLGSAIYARENSLLTDVSMEYVVSHGKSDGVNKALVVQYLQGRDIDISLYPLTLDNMPLESITRDIAQGLHAVNLHESRGSNQSWLNKSYSYDECQRAAKNTLHKVAVIHERLNDLNIPDNRLHECQSLLVSMVKESVAADKFLGDKQFPKSGSKEFVKEMVRFHNASGDYHRPLNHVLTHPKFGYDSLSSDTQALIAPVMAQLDDIKEMQHHQKVEQAIFDGVEFPPRPEYLTETILGQERQDKFDHVHHHDEPSHDEMELYI